MTVWSRYKPYILQVALALGVGGVSALLSGEMNLYEQLTKPLLSPPGWVFPVAWTILYILMGLAAGLVIAARDTDSSRAMRFYYGQLVLNLLWAPLFFRLGWITFAAVWLGALVAAVYCTRRLFCRISATAGWLLLPYLLWCLFALYLNIGFVVLN